MSFSCALFFEFGLMCTIQYSFCPFFILCPLAFLCCTENSNHPLPSNLRTPLRSNFRYAHANYAPLQSPTHKLSSKRREHHKKLIRAVFFLPSTATPNITQLHQPTSTIKRSTQSCPYQIGPTPRSSPTTGGSRDELFCCCCCRTRSIGP